MTLSIILGLFAGVVAIALLLYFLFYVYGLSKVTMAADREKRLKARSRQDVLERMFAIGATDRDILAAKERWHIQDEEERRIASGLPRKVPEHILILPSLVITYATDEAATAPIEARIRRLLDTNPHIDLRAYESHIGARIVKIDKAKSQPSRHGFLGRST